MKRLLRALTAPAPDPRRTYRDAASLRAELRAATSGHPGPVEQQLGERLEALVERQRMLAARRDAAEAQVRVGEALAGISEELGAVGPDLARTEEEAEELEARAAAIARLLDAESKI